MKKVWSACLLILVEIVFIFLAIGIMGQLEDHYCPFVDEGYDERRTNTYEVTSDRKEQYDLESDYVRLLRYLPSDTVVRTSREVADYDIYMQIYGEENGYAIIKDDNKWNVYGPEGKKVFEKDVVFSSNRGYLYQLNFEDKGTLIVNRSTGEYFDFEGKPVSNFYTFMNRLLFAHYDFLTVLLVGLFMIIAGLIWFFLLRKWVK